MADEPTIAAASITVTQAQNIIVTFNQSFISDQG